VIASADKEAPVENETVKGHSSSLIAAVSAAVSAAASAANSSAVSSTAADVSAARALAGTRATLAHISTYLDSIKIPPPVGGRSAW
jgi:hypothetical protein